MKLPIVACSEKGDNTKIYVDADDIEKVSPLLSLKKNDIWRHSVEMAKSQWYRVDKVEYFDRTITKEQGNGLYMYGEYERAAQKEIVLIDDNEMFVQWGRSILNLAGQFFFSGIDRCFELKKKKEQMVEDLPDMDR